METVSLYRNGPFTDLCAGPHGPSTKRIKAFKLTSLAGAYWRGDAERQMLTRIYGTAFLSKEDLDEHLRRLEQARERDHRRLGRELSLFMLSDLAPGMPFWLPRGTHIWNELTAMWRRANVERGYTEVRTPILYDVDLWKRSGHWHVYRENMYFTDVEERAMGLKPMNCPAHVQIYKRELRSYRDLPIRYCEQGLVHRHEPSGTLHGLLRVRQITQDDAHVFCTEEQIEEEAMRCIDFGFFMYRAVRPRAAAGALDAAGEARGHRRDVGQGRGGAGARPRENGLEYDLNEGDGAFYGPKIDAHITDAIGRSWQLGTVQLDYYMPEQFELAYTGADNAEHRPVMIHRASMGSFERFIGILIEHYAGEFPLWLAPVQACVLPIADRHVPYARAGRRPAERRAAAHRGGRALGVGGQEDPRGGSAQGPVHARGGRPGGERRNGGGAPPPRGRPGRDAESAISRHARARRSCSAPESAAILAPEWRAPSSRAKEAADAPVPLPDSRRAAFDVQP